MPEITDPLLLSGSQIASDEVAIDYIKAADFRVIWADGLIGGATPANLIHFGLYAERPAFPRRQIHKVDQSTFELGPSLPNRTIGRNSVVRELACDVLLTPATALSMAEWLISQVEALKKREGSQ